ncbi:Protein of unknown function [Shimia gijangensis]|uniref:DUF3489 domain-containing protein n=1 Tax=Shimia gijangensis TaxID=1470563 RepID=A0A1M6Q658_9RHOB|nr:DUF3489 domain-containing protein [Shimia gijangensis]SHK15769.1 Protein of unknown function [Shimia gijangensis]
MTQETAPQRLKPPASAFAKAQVANTTRPVQLRKLLTRKSGATIVQIQRAFGWQPHTARAAISGLRKLGEIIERSETPRGPVYRIVPTEAVT